MTRIYKTPFATTGDKEPLAVNEQPDGKVSLPTGWTYVYALEPGTPGYKPVGRAEMNGILNEVTESLAELQLQGGVVRWQAVDGGFNKGAMVYGADLQTIWQSTVNNNLTDPDSVGSSGWAFVSIKKPRFNVVKIEASGTYTPTPGTQFIIVEGVGGGGAGGGATVSTSGMTSIGSGGGAGGYCKSKINISEIVGSVSVTIGAGGTGVNGSSGSGGGTTSFGAFFTCAGGLAGQRAGPANASFGTGGGFGGVASGANILNFRGERGGNAFTTYPSYTFGGNGGGGPLGTGGQYAANANGANGYGYGSGGGGVEISSGPTGTYRGGNGADGVVIITEFILE